jgi:hypothetical protein
VLGSVGHHCAAHSHCPVVVVHTPSQRVRRAPKRRKAEPGAT